MKIMIVDDNAAMRETIQQVLIGTRATFYPISNGHEAVLMYDRVLPDWVLMDIQMKEMDGLRATEIITQSYPDARIIIVTNYNDREFRDEAVRLHTRGYVLKENLPELRGIIGTG
jgi:CheY-like chemotaxis protein